MKRLKTLHILKTLSIFLCILLANQSFAQKITVQGKIKNGLDNQPVEFATIFFKNTIISTDSDDNGYFILSTDWSEGLTISISRLGFKEFESPIKEPKNIFLEITLAPQESEVEVIITENRLKATEMIRERAEELKFLPSVSGNFESILPHIALGTRGGTGGELSSQYQVRGGNYDENLVYVNDFEIFRPQLISNSQQEGLSFPNADLMRDLSFSSGGYEAKYGDKMSSVLDIKYKRPQDFHGSISASILGGSTHFEGSTKIGKHDFNQLRYLFGARYKTTQYLLSTLDTEGQYTPRHSDLQGYLTYDLTKDIQLGFMGNYNQSRYDFIPVSRATAIGLIDFALELNTVFEGRESDAFKTGMGGMSVTYIPEKDRNPIFLKFLASRYLSKEFENFNITGFYRLSQIESNLGAENVGEEVAVLGVGSEQEFGRNSLQSQVTNFELRGGVELQPKQGNKPVHFLQWGLKYQREIMDDKLNEWIRIDSAGYSVPSSDQQVLIWNILKSENELKSNRISGFFQNSIDFKNNDSDIKVNVGVRFSHWSLTDEFIISPRAQLLFKPKGGDTKISYKIAGGIYYQSPFYRELRRPDGTINNNLKSQQSIHALGGLTYDFFWKDISTKPFKIITEVYYKKFSNLTSYEIDNVRLRYSGENDATGYAAGIDFRLNGAFVPGTESWLNFSLLTTRENITDVQHFDVEIGQEPRKVENVPRPSDQFFNISIFFQDYLPGNENFKVNLNMIFGSGLPFGLRDNNKKFRNVFRYKGYKRVDIGFAFHMWDKSRRSKHPQSIFRSLDNAWLTLEVFNLMGIENVSSNTWVRTIFNQQFAVPNNLTTRRINLKFKIEF
ncbi:MAG: carboxypeptidase-like regulatory domain-containing protein [Saprospiraceae bacterium]